MNEPLKLQKPWAEVKEKLMEINLDLTDADLQYDERDPHLLLVRLSKKMNRTEQEVKGWIESVSGNERIAG